MPKTLIAVAKEAHEALVVALRVLDRHGLTAEYQQEAAQAGVQDGVVDRLRDARFIADDRLRMIAEKLAKAQEELSGAEFHVYCTSLHMKETIDELHRESVLW